MSEEIVRAAGGLVFRKGDAGGAEIVLVHRSAYNDWTFPKGKLDPGESEPQAALREVEEETSLVCTLGREAGLTSYRDPAGRPSTLTTARRPTRRHDSPKNDAALSAR